MHATTKCERAADLTSWMRRSVDMQIGDLLVRRLTLEPRCMVSSSRGLAVESQLTPVATLVVHLLAFAVPIRGRHMELRDCSLPADQHGCMISFIWVCTLAVSDGRS